MCETLESAAEKTGDLLLASIFNLQFDEGQRKAVLFEFSSAAIQQMVEQRVAPMGVRFQPFDMHKKDAFIRVALIDDVLRTKMSVMCECAVRREQYRKLGKDVDFVCHGLDWAAPPGTPDERLTLRQKVYKYSYGDAERNARAASEIVHQVSDLPPLPHCPGSTCKLTSGCDYSPPQPSLSAQQASPLQLAAQPASDVAKTD